MYYKNKSPIHGVGVFSNQNILKGTKICDYIGVEMSWKDFKKKSFSKKFKQDIFYVCRPT